MNSDMLLSIEDVLEELKVEIKSAVVVNQTVKYVVALRPVKSKSLEHTVERSYSEFRSLFKRLLRVSNCKKVDSCTCLYGTCPFWSLFLLLRQYEFPKKHLSNNLFNTNQEQQERLTHRRLELSLFLQCLLAKLQSFRDVLQNNNSKRNRSDCLVMSTIENFFQFTPEIATRFLHNSTPTLLNLQGWQSDRCNLYFLGPADATTTEKERTIE